MRLSKLACIGLILILSICSVSFAAATVGNTIPIRTIPKLPLIIPPPPDLDAKSFILMDYNTGEILAQNNIHDQLAPASLTKLMALYVVFNAINSGQIKLTDNVPISEAAWKTGGSKMFVRVGTMIPVEDLIQGVIVDSGNDATVALAEYVAGSQQGFVALMNQQATTLGMKDSHFSNVNGLPVDDHHSSAYDLAILARALDQNFPDQYHWFKQQYFTWEKIKQANRNWLVFRDPSVDGLKTGYTAAAGYCLVASATRGTTHLISVVMGAPSEMGRVEESERLLNYGFRFFKTVKIYGANNTITQARVWGGANSSVALGLSRDLFLTIPNGQENQLKFDVHLNTTLHAPIVKGQTYGTLTVTLHKKLLLQESLVALQNDKAGGFWTRLSDSVSLHMHEWFSKGSSQG